MSNGQPPTYNPPQQTGAHIQQHYMRRVQKCVAVNQQDLDELLTFDLLQQALTGAGLFFLSGSFWLLIDKLLEQDKFQLSGPVVACGIGVVAGLVLFGAGLALFFMRRGKVQKIFSETQEVVPPDGR